MKEEKTFQLEVVTMDTVPPAPRARTSVRYAQLYMRIANLGMGERNAVKIACESKKFFLACRASLRKMAESDGKQLCSSRTLDYKFGYFWLVKPEK
jgi:hypothetical protein